MKEKDKILINSYLDHELSDDESNYVDELLKNDEKAKEYLEKIKAVNLEISAFSNDSDQEKLNRNIKTYVNEKIRPRLNQKTAGQDFLSLLFKPSFYNFAGYSATALLFFGIGSNYLYQDNGLESFQEQSLELEYLKLRSSDPQKFEELILDATSRIIDQKLLSAKINIGNELYQLNLKSSKYPCYYGELLNNNQKADLVICITESEKNIIFFD